jgi:ribose/xylose/arabinose/galactoside ABC-type transport system permease subunit
MVNGEIRSASNQRLAKSRLLSMFSRVAVLVVMMVAMAFLSPSFFTVSNLLNILRQAAPIFIIGAGQTIVILARGIDLSMDSVASLTGVIMATIMVDNHVPFYVAMPLGLLMGMCMGFVNGFIITKIKLPAFVTTFGTYLLFKGLTVLWARGRVISGFSESFHFLGVGRVLGIPVIIFIAMAVYLIIRVLLKHTTFGRKIYAIGSNPDASRVSGIQIERILIIAYILSAVLATFGSQLYISRINSAKSDFGEGFASDAIAATLIGGTSFEGGVGTIEGTVIGAIIIILLQNAMNLLGISTYWQGFATGLVMIVAVLGDTYLNNFAKKYEG